MGNAVSLAETLIQSRADDADNGLPPNMNDPAAIILRQFEAAH